MKKWIVLLSMVLIVRSAAGQASATGFPPFGSFQNGGFDSINRQNLNTNIAFPIVSSPGRGLNFNFSIVYDSLLWKKSGSVWAPVADSSGIPTWGWKRDMPSGRISYVTQNLTCTTYPPPDYIEVIEYSVHYYGFVYTDAAGTLHPFDIDYYTEETACGYSPVGGPTEGYAGDGSGIYFNGYAVTVPDGMESTNTSLKDTNGNYSSYVYVSSTEFHWKDSLGRIALKVKKVSNSTWEYRRLDASGTYQLYTVTNTSFNIKTNFACSGVSEYTQNSVYLPTTIALPNSPSYTIEYEDTPSQSGFKTGRIKKVTLPTGGSYEYIYPTDQNNGINCSDGSVKRLTRKINEGSNQFVWDYTRTQSGSDWKTRVTPPALSYDSGVSNESTFTFNSSGQQTSAKFYQGTEASNNPLRTINTTWSNGTPASQTVILEDTPGASKLQSKTLTTIDSYGNLKELYEYDYGSGAPPSAYVRKTTFAYLHESSSAYADRNIRNRVSSIQVYDSSGTSKKAETLIEYDQGTIVSATGAPQHDDSSFGTGFSTRGNPTKVRRWLTGTTYLDTAQTYDMLGNVKTIQDPGSHTTSIDYADSWSGTACTFTSTTYAYPSKVTNAASQDTRFKFFPCTGQVQAVQDPNDYGNSRNGTEFAYADSMLRLTQVKSPDGGQTDITYHDSTLDVVTQVKRTSTATITTTDYFNTLGQLKQRALPGSRLIDVAYDSLGGQWNVTNPYVSTSDSTYGLVETRVDGLGRVKSVIQQDGTSTVQFSYAGNATSATDEVSRQRVVQYDGLGRMTNVCEVTSGNSRSSAANCSISPFSSASGYLTAYTFNERGDLTQSTSGGQTRTFSYDNLSRLTGARIREVSTSADVTYDYDSDSNRTAITDTRGKVCLDYDSLHRVTAKKHTTSTCSSGTVKAEFTYGTSATNNTIGRLVNEKDGTGTGVDKTDYTYDPVGRMLSMTRTVSSTGYVMSYDYDYLGNLLHVSYPSSSGTRRKVEYAFNSNGESTSVKDITDSNQSNWYNYVSNVSYSNLGPLSQMDFGSPTYPNLPVRTTIGWTKRALIDSILTQVTGGGATYLNLGYVYNADAKIQKVKFNNDVNDLKTETYTYDDLGRLLTAQRGPDTNIQRKYSYDYDRWGNRWAQTVTAGSGLGGTLAFDNSNYSNRITDTGFSYTEGSVTAGNLTANGSGTSYTYNQENFMTAASSTYGTPSYAVDAQGRRVKKTVSGTTTDYFYVGADLISEKTGSTWKDYIFFAGQRMAEQTGSTAASAIYLHTDHLGSTRRCTDANGGSAGTCDYEPFGENLPPTSTSCSVPTRFRFAGMDFDADTELYHTWFREYDPNQGRWMAVDPLPGSEDDPQSRNRYVYVSNDPANLMDPLGLSPWWVDAFFNFIDGCIDAGGSIDWGEGGFLRGNSMTCRLKASGNGGGGPGSEGPRGGSTGSGNPQQPQPPPPPPPCVPESSLNTAERILFNTLSFWSRVTGVSYSAGGSVTRTPSILGPLGVTYGVSRVYAADPQGGRAIVTSVVMQASVGSPASNASVTLGGATYQTVDGFDGPSEGVEVQRAVAGPVTFGFSGNRNPSGISTSASFGVGTGARVSAGRSLTVATQVTRVCP